MNEERRDKKPEITAIYSLALAVAIQAGGGLWWASRLDTRVEHLTQQITEMRERIVYLERAEYDRRPRP